jgi:5-methylthioadenosine/S-adenosylhomocysteine deaminase
VTDDHAPRGRYVLIGRIVTMGPAEVLDDGALYVNDGTIENVLTDSERGPAEYAAAPRIRTGGTIYPGFIELHNHLSYNTMPLWDVPQRYTNNGQWRGIEPYTRRITKPSQVLGQTNGAAQALVRFGECRALLGGTTCSQGVTLASANGITKLYTGLLRNPEKPDDDRLPAAQANIANPDTGGASAYLQKLAGSKSYLQHLSEGTDATAREWFQRLQIDETTWAVNDVLCGIHCTALNRDDFRILADRGATMVWSPLSNYLLYGDTADIVAAKESHISISLGSDWAPSGSKNLLGELKVAALASQQRGDVFTPRELVQMITVNPARSLKWDALLGSIEPGKLADLVVVAGLSGDPYELLLQARASSVTLVVIGGVPRVGQPQLMRRFWDVPLQDVDWIDEIHVGTSRRQLFVEAPDDVLDGLKLSAAMETLRDAMARLPELAKDVDRALEGIGADVAGGLALGGETFRVVPDFEDEDAHFAASHDAALAAKPYAFWVTEPMSLEPITVVDDHMFLRHLQRAGNLPDFVKRGLPQLYGQHD